MSDGMRDNADLSVDTSPRGIAISDIAAMSRERLLEIAWAAYDAGILRPSDLKPRAKYRRRLTAGTGEER